ncbi:disulfide bond formation protein DsbB [Deinococcus reticulitermitis]|uniref:Disulfide bond formation protein DsbB n=2 Tax=Deinococcus reticulitermitis TaxID=856736 RepID=A0A1H7C4G1_9DEIO|nr:disulfide bond formation protein DsbB [Deinococcus reticulitermitis]
MVSEMQISSGGRWAWPYVAWLQAVVATTGSLYFSEVMHLPPCTLCWYQRLMMYPLVFVLLVSLLTQDTRLRAYSLPLSVTGLLIAAYHNLLYYGVIPEGLTQCAAGVSCTARQLEWLGFITIPLLSLTAFTVITLSLLLTKPRGTA